MRPSWVFVLPVSMSPKYLKEDVTILQRALPVTQLGNPQGSQETAVWGSVSPSTSLLRIVVDYAGDIICNQAGVMTIQ